MEILEFAEFVIIMMFLYMVAKYLLTIIILNHPTVRKAVELGNNVTLGGIKAELGEKKDVE